MMLIVKNEGLRSKMKEIQGVSSMKLENFFWFFDTQLTLWSDTSMVLQVILETVSQEKLQKVMIKLSRSYSLQEIN